MRIAAQYSFNNGLAEVNARYESRGIADIDILVLILGIDV